MYYGIRRHYVENKMTERKVFTLENDQQLEWATGKDTVRFFKRFGKCYSRHVNGKGWHFVTCCGDEKSEDWIYGSIKDLLRFEYVSEQELADLERR